MKRYIATVLCFMIILSVMVTPAFVMDNGTGASDNGDTPIFEMQDQFDTGCSVAIPSSESYAGRAIDLASSTLSGTLKKDGLANFTSDLEFDFSNAVIVTSELQRYSDSAEETFGDFSENLFASDISPLDSSENKPPVANPKFIIMNPDSLKNGQYTTETMVFIATRWDNVDLCYDPEGSSLAMMHNDTFPEGYVNYFEDSTGSTAGYAINIFNAGTYPFVFAFYDVYGAASELFGINFNVLQRGTFETIAGVLSSATDQRQYDITVDFSIADEYSIDAVRTGLGGFTYTIFNSEETEIGSSDCSGPGSSQTVGTHFVLEKPEGVLGECTYTIKVNSTSNRYVDGDTSFRIAYGPSSQRQYFFEDVIDGMSLPYYHRFRNYKQNLANYIQGIAISDHGYYYKIEATGQETVTLSSSNADCYFKVLDAKTFETLFDSRSTVSGLVDGRNAYYTVVTLNFSAGESYYIVTCNQSTTNYDSVSVITVGDPRVNMGKISYTVAPRTLTEDQPFTLSLDVTAPEGVGVYAYDLIHLANEAGWNISLSAKSPGSTNWRTTSLSMIDYSYDNPDAPLVNAVGEWLIRLTPNKSGYYSGGKITLTYMYDIT